MAAALDKDAARASACSSEMLPASVSDSRETLRAMIHLEQKFYQRSSYLFPSDDEFDGCEEENEQDSSNSNRNGKGMCRSSSLSMIEEMASLVTDLETAAEAAESNHDVQEQEEAPAQQQQQQACMSTPVFNVDKKSFRKAHSPTSSADNLYEDMEQPAQPKQHAHNRSSGSRRRRRRRPSALEISCLSNWRHQMFDWTCSVCQGFLMAETSSSGTVVATTLSILDQYLSIVLSKKNEPEHEQEHNTQCGNPLGISKEDFQLYVMVSLYIAAKTLISADRNKLTIAAMVTISQGFYTPHDITATERDILLALDWHVNPPTVSCFCKMFLDLFPFEHDDCEPQSMSCMSRHQCEYLAELALDDVFFLDKAASTVGLAVVVLVTDSLRNKATSRRRSRGGALSTFLQSIQGVVNVHNSEFDSILRRLECFM